MCEPDPEILGLKIPGKLGSVIPKPVQIPLVGSLETTSKSKY
jgi:hypothetical protein